MQTSAGARSRLDAVAAGHRAARWIELLARLGYVAKGVVYGLVGLLALRLAFGDGGEVTGPRGALQEIGDGSFGRVALALIALGLVGYALWRLVQGIRDVEGDGDDLGGIVQRIGYVGSGVLHGALAFYAASLATSGSGSGGDGSGNRAAQGLTAELLSHPWGVWLVVAVGVVTAIVGLYQFKLAWEASFRRHWKTAEMSPAQSLWGTRAARLGLAARGVVFAMIGVFFVQAARQSDPGEAKGLGGALAELAADSSGAWLLAAVAFGLVCYAVYCFVQARYRHFEVR